jgi:Zn finger protein HypA/HybF involved in hydrogenase expression
LLCCEECGCLSDVARGWIGQIVDDHESPEAQRDVAVYCPVCAQREFEMVSPRGLPYPSKFK